MRSIVLIATMILCTLQTALWADPVLTVTEDRRGEWVFTGLTQPAVEIDEESGCDAIPWVFSWEAVPGDPIGTITDYRYGFDIVDLDDPLAWDIDWTPGATSAPPRALYSGTHTFHVEARNDKGVITRASFVVNMTAVQWLPTLTVIEATRGDWAFIGLAGPVVKLTDPLTSPITPWAFAWEAVACGKDNFVDAFRYGWDITDPADDTLWSPWGDVSLAPPREFTAGVHNFMVEVRDDAGSVTRGTIAFEITQSPVPVRSATWGGIKAKYSE